MVWKNQMASIRNEKPALDGNRHGILNRFGFFNERERIQNDTATNDAFHVRMENARRYQMEDVPALPEANSMARIMAALIPRDTVVLLRQDVDYFAFSLVAPLNANDCEILFH